MKRNTQKLLALLLTLVLVLGLLPGAALAEEALPGNGADSLGEQVEQSEPAEENTVPEEPAQDEENTASEEPAGDGEEQDVFDMQPALAASLETAMLALYSAPAVITSADDLAALAAAVNGGDNCEGQTITLAGDIVLTGEWTPIGTPAAPFSGTFDGQGYTISGLSIHTDSDYVGLFGCLAPGGTIKNLVVEGEVTTTGSYAAGLVASCEGTVENCGNQAAVTGSGGVGGVAGSAGYGSMIRSCYNAGTISGSAAIGGVMGISECTIENCYNVGAVTGGMNGCGGIAGQGMDGSISNCYNAGTITAEDACFGAIVGIDGGCWQEFDANCFYLEGSAPQGITANWESCITAAAKSSAELKALAETLGEAFTADSGSINNGYPVLAWQKAEQEDTPIVSPDLVITTAEQFQAFAGAVNGGNNFQDQLIVLEANLDLGGTQWTPIGSSSTAFKGTFDGGYHTISGLNITGSGSISHQGLFGYNAGTIQNLTVSGTISVSTTTMNGYIAGIAGYNSGTISNCANDVNVTVTAASTSVGYYTGGVAGYSTSTISCCVNRGAVTGTTAVGGIVGRSASTTENCYNLGTISGTGSYFGGIVGQIMGSVKNCYNIGSISGSSGVGGVVGNKKTGSGSNNYYLTGTAATDAAGAAAVTESELADLADTLGDAFEPGAGGYPVLVWEKYVDTSIPDVPAGPVFPEASATSEALSTYIRAAINAKKVQAGLSESDSLLSTYTISDTSTDWIAVTMGRYGYRDGDTYHFLYDDGSGYTDYIAALQAYVTQKYADNGGKLHDKKATEWQRLILAVNAIGGDPTSFGAYDGQSVDLVNDGTYNHAAPGWQGINGTIFGLIALDTKVYDVPENAVTSREKFITDILALQLVDGVNGNELGGWALTGSVSDPDISAMAIQALAPYYNDTAEYTYTNKALNREVTQTIRQAVNAALDKLGAIQLADGDYASWGTVNVESTAQVLVALCSLGIDPAQDERFVKNGNTLLDGILKYRLSGGGFTHTYSPDPANPSSDPGQYNYMATDQASYAMVAYWRLENGMRALYDMRDEWTGSERAAIDAAMAAIAAVPAPSAANYKAALKSALASFRAMPESERRYVYSYNDLAQAIEMAGGEGALDSEEKYPVSMTMTTPPAKTTYIEGEPFDPAGMVLTLTYSDGSAEAVTSYTCQPAGELSVSTKEIAISAKGFTVTVSITVNEQAPWSGAGTEQDPYLIQNLDGLLALGVWVDAKAKSTLDVYFKMTADIDMAGLYGAWSPIGSTHAFQGVFDGDGHCLKNYEPASGSRGLGIFGTVSGTVKNFGVASGMVVQDNYFTSQGVIVNTLSGGTVLNCWNAADVTFKGGYAGAIVGDCRTGNNLIEGCYNLGTIHSPDASGPIGGIIGYIGANYPNTVSVTIQNCYNMGVVISPLDMGGIVGKNQGNLTMAHCYNAGTITCTSTYTTAKAAVGALIGGCYGSPAITSCYCLADNYTITDADAATITDVGEAKTAEEMKAADFIALLGGGFQADSASEPINGGYPVLAWQKLPAAAVILTFAVTPAGAQISVADAAGKSVSPNPDGTYTVRPDAVYSYSVSAEGYVTASGSIAIPKDQTVTVALKANSSSSESPQPVEDPLKEHREKALNSLKDQYDKFYESDYSPGNWAVLKAAYEKGIQNINAAKAAEPPYEENNIIAALNAAIAAMQAVEASRTGTVTVAVSVDANTLGLGYLVKPTLVEVDRYTKASVVLTDLLRDNGYTWELTGTIENGFYLAGIRPVDQTQATVAPFIVAAMGGESGIMYSDRNDTKLGEFDYCNMSGWMYSVNGSFPGVGAASWNMSAGEVMRWQFTVYGYGADLNADNTSWGQSSIIPTLGNKDALTWDVAALRGQYGDDVLEANEVYQAAIDVLTDPTATQSQIQTAQNNLASAKFDAQPEQPATPGSSSTGSSAGGGSITAVDSTPTVADGTAAVVVDKAQIEQALESAGKNGTLVINAGTSEKVDTVTVSVPAGSLADAAAVQTSVNIQSAIGSVTLPASSLSALTGGGAVQVDMTLNDLAGTLRITVAVDGVTVLDLPSKFSFAIPDAVNVPLASGTGNTIQPNLVAVLVGKDGSETVLQKSVVQGSTVYAQLAGSSEVTVRNNAKTFTDVTVRDWYYDYVSFAASHDLFHGISETSFDPAGTMTRAMLVTVLHRLENTPETAASGVFQDVAGNQWYTDAVIWANENQIVEGYGDGSFGAADHITREQLAVMLYRYAGYLGFDTSPRGDLSAFTDCEQVSGWAVEAMQWAVQTGLVNGRDDQTLDPSGEATRAEAAAILQRLVALIVL